MRIAIAFLLLPFFADAQIVRAWPFYTAPEAAASGNLLLDDYPGAAVAYSLRKLDKDYTGSAIRVRRSNDNTEQDIGFVNNYLDTASMKTFVGVDSGFVAKWYDQSGNANDLVQTSATAQARIINAGSIELESGKPTMYYDGGDGYLFEDTVRVNGNTFVNVMNPLTDNSWSIYAFSNSSWIFPIATSGSTSSITNGYTINSMNVNGSSFTGNRGDLYTLTTSDYVVIDINATTAQNSPIDRIYNRSTFLLTGNSQELIIWSTDKTSDLSSIRANINAFYSIY